MTFRWPRWIVLASGTSILSLLAGAARGQATEEGGSGSGTKPAASGPSLFPRESAPVTITPGGSSGGGGYGKAIRKAKGVKYTTTMDGRGTGEPEDGSGGEGGGDFVDLSGYARRGGSSGGSSRSTGSSGYGSGSWFSTDRDESPIYQGVIPEVHTVQKTDTLWDICSYYFGDPWRWPSVWALNPQITNPHWIYPGEKVRLRGAGELAEVPSGVITTGVVRAHFDPLVRARQTGFIDTREHAKSGSIVGAGEDREMLADYDSVYLTFPKDAPQVKVGQRLSIYRPVVELSSDTRGKVGTMIINLGSLIVEKVPKDAHILARVTGSVASVIMRGDRVGLLRDDQRSVLPTPNRVDATGRVIEELRHPDNEISGAENFLVIDLGRKQGIEVGNTLMLVRRGDSGPGVFGTNPNIDLRDDPAFPYEVVGDLMVMDVSESASIAVVTSSLREIVFGQKVVIRKERGAESVPAASSKGR